MSIIERFGQHFSDVSGLHNECIDLRDFLGGELAPTLGRRAAVDAGKKHLNFGDAETYMLGEPHHGQAL
jgi:hypothetical protein